MARYIALTSCVLGLAALGSSLSAQSAEDRCAAARELLEDRDSLSDSEVRYFEAIVKGDCSGSDSNSIVHKNDALRSAARESAPRRSRSPAAAALARSDPKKPQPAKLQKRSLVLPSGPFGHERCDSAASYLAKRELTDQSDATRVQEHIFSSQECQTRRYDRATQLSAAPAMAEMARRLKANGIDIDARMPAQIERCRLEAEAASDGAPVSTDELLQSTCVANARVVVYAAAIEELNATSNASYEQEMARHRQEVAELEREKQEIERKAAEDKAAYDKSMADWRRAVALCEQGKTEYCQQDDGS